MPAYTIAIISVYPRNTALLDLALRQAGYQTILWRDPYSAYPMIRDKQPNLVVLDLWPKYPATGAMLLMLLHLDTAVRNVPILICASEPRISGDAAIAAAQPSVDLLLKPFDLDAVRRLIEQRIGASQAQPEASPREASARV